MGHKNLNNKDGKQVQYQSKVPKRKKLRG